MSVLPPVSAPTAPHKTRWLPIGIALILIAFLVYTTLQETGFGVGLDPASIPPPTLGGANARVEIVEYADLGCPVCRSWHSSGIRNAILAEYGDQVRFVWRDFPVITPQSPQAAEAAHCAAAQGKFWEYHDTVFAQYAGLNPDALRGYAAQVGLDLAAFDGCLARGDMRQVVQANDRMARQVGLRGTPGFTVNGQPLPAPPTLEQLSALIAQELARGGS
jgi:protein-disulfide isomerase